MKSTKCLGLVLAGALAVSGTPAGGAATVENLSRINEPTPAAPGIGDDYFPLAGNGGIDVQNYRISTRWNFRTRVLSGKTAVRLRTTQDLSTVNLDFLLKPTSVTVNGVEAMFRRVLNHDLKIVLPQAATAGTPLQIVVSYRDQPFKYKDPDDSNGYQGFSGLRSRNEAVIVGSPGWFPANDHPRDRATYRFDLTVPKGNRAIANGTPGSNKVDGNWRTFTWRMNESMMTKDAFFAVGRYKLERGETNGLPWVSATERSVLGNKTGKTRQLVKAVAWFEAELGPFPFDTLGAVVTGARNGQWSVQGRYIEPGWYNPGPYQAKMWGAQQQAIAEQWFRSAISINNWRDVWLADSFPQYLRWRWDETHGVIGVRERLRHEYDSVPVTNSAYWGSPTADPGVDGIANVKWRGAMALAALRNRIGDEAFNTLVRTWVTQEIGGVATTEEFAALAEQISGQDLDDFFQAWLYSPDRPADTVANGLGY